MERSLRYGRIGSSPQHVNYFWSHDYKNRYATPAQPPQPDVRQIKRMQGLIEQMGVAELDARSPVRTVLIFPRMFFA